ncbi:MAG: hypothetical protein AVDCRST_MAG68-3837, partial [uncultured Gemmatimonadetes bacterium]
ARSATIPRDFGTSRAARPALAGSRRAGSAFGPPQAAI